jgi:hypothetical protein
MPAEQKSSEEGQFVAQRSAPGPRKLALVLRHSQEDVHMHDGRGRIQATASRRPTIIAARYGFTVVPGARADSGSTR